MNTAAAARALSSKSPAEIDARLVEVQREADALRRQLAALEAEEAVIAEAHRVRQWSRSFLVSGGHLHSSTACSTCYPTTSFFFIPALSGMTAEEIVDEAGERACTVCFPDAPVDALRRPSSLRTPDEAEAEAARNARESARAQKAAEAIVVEGLDEYRGRAHTFKSERALANFVSSQLKSVHVWRMIGETNGRGDHPDTEKWLADARTAAEALAARRGVDVDALLLSISETAKKNAKRELR